ncbi:PadR family transcriptional regulator, partial [Kitasatospora sp. NPDC047058]|uniref:PadR family transcriptional regulator n=1 Tax=Kitasatospora sp. NPDC047058 TaxID=3155620 RepID=UPI0033D289BC
MLTLAILGFLHDEPLHGYELKSRITGLTGHVRPVSDGALYPAITRLEKAGLLVRRSEPGSGAVPRQVLELTAEGRAELARRLADPDQVEISDQIRPLSGRRRGRVLRRRQADVLRHRHGVH